MNPCDALQQDWGMYYHEAWMYHIKDGPVRVVVMDGSLHYYKYPNDRAEALPTPVAPEHLECWWPRSGAYNTPRGAVYLARKTSRSMRKSAHPSEHFVLLWGQGEPYGTPKMMLQLRKGHSFVDLDFAKKAIAEKMTSSVAVASDIILAASEDEDVLKVIFRGVLCGTLIIDDDYGTFKPDYDCAVGRRAAMRLQEEGIV